MLKPKDESVSDSSTSIARDGPSSGDIARPGVSLSGEIPCAGDRSKHGRAVDDWIRRFMLDLGAAESSFAAKRAAVEERVPHAQLRLCLQSDPSMQAMLPALPVCVSLGDETCGPFRIAPSGVVLLAPILLADSAAMAMALRWAIEARGAAHRESDVSGIIAASVRHAQHLFEMLRGGSRDLMLSVLPGDVAVDLARSASGASTPLCRWVAQLVGATLDDGQGPPSDESEFDLPVESILVRGGDSRLTIDPISGLNRYGVCPRPRPEAIHFSSSTASAVSEHGFLACELLRRWARDFVRSGVSEDEIRASIMDTIVRGLQDLLGLEEAGSDVVVLPSGTDAELATVMMATAASGNRRLTSILIAPDESGRGVRMAASGQYFDSESSNGVPISKGARAFGGPEPAVLEVPIRDRDCRERSLEEIDRDVNELVSAAIAAGDHVLVHVLHGSKTGLIAPSRDAIARLRREHPDRVDIAIDACQLRSDWLELGELVRAGCVVQTSGSKFLTGPPFSGALLLPTSYRGRLEAVQEHLAKAPAVAHSECWRGWWRGRLERASAAPSAAPSFRWIPALLEAELYRQVPREKIVDAMERFRTEIVPRVTASHHLRPLDDAIATDDRTETLRWSIVAFEVMAARGDGSLAALAAESGQRFFERLNEDLSSGHPGGMRESDRAIASVCCHIGQPVTLERDGSHVTVLRLVLGARFFNAIGHVNGPGSEAALESEISDAKRVLAKIEWLASRWWQYDRSFGGSA